MDLYLVILEDRHSDVDIYPFLDEQRATRYAKQLVAEIARHPEDIEWDKPLNDAMVADGWVYYLRYSVEGDSVKVIKRTAIT